MLSHVTVTGCRAGTADELVNAVVVWQCQPLLHLHGLLRAWTRLQSEAAVQTACLFLSDTAHSIDNESLLHERFMSQFVWHSATIKAQTCCSQEVSSKLKHLCQCPRKVAATLIAARRMC